MGFVATKLGTMPMLFLVLYVRQRAANKFSTFISYDVLLSLSESQHPTDVCPNGDTID